MFEILIIILLIAVLASLQNIKAAHKASDKQRSRMEIEMFKMRLGLNSVKQSSVSIEVNLRSLIEWLPPQLDTLHSFNHMQQATNDDALNRVALAAVLMSKPDVTIKEVKTKKRK